MNPLPKKIIAIEVVHKIQGLLDSGEKSIPSSLVRQLLLANLQVHQRWKARFEKLHKSHEHLVQERSRLLRAAAELLTANKQLNRILATKIPSRSHPEGTKSESEGK